MNGSLSSLPFFFVALIFGSMMIVEAIIILRNQRQVVPIPTRIVVWLGSKVVGREKISQRFAGNNTPENMRMYAYVALFFGMALLVSGGVYLVGR